MSLVEGQCERCGAEAASAWTYQCQDCLELQQSIQSHMLASQDRRREQMRALERASKLAGPEQMLARAEARVSEALSDVYTARRLIAQAALDAREIAWSEELERRGAA